MSISGIETKYQNYVPSGNSSSRSSSTSTVDSFQDLLVNLEKRVKDALKKEHENDNTGNIQMSEKQWRNLIKKVDSAIDTIKDNIQEQEQEAKKQVEEKIQAQKHKIEESM